MRRAVDTLRVGWASEDITPQKPVELCGQYYQRVSRRVRDPHHATALALESTQSDGRNTQAIMMSLDILHLKRNLQEELRGRVRSALPDFDATRLFLNAIHTHNAPQPTASRNWWTPDPSVITPDEYRALLLDRMERAAITAWRNRRPGGISWSLGHATVGHCRRALYADGTAEMYGRTDRRDFIGMEAGEDSGVDMVFCWGPRRKPTGVIVNLACPAQVMEARYCVTADFVGALRHELRERLSKNFFVLAQIAPSGDQSPRDLGRNYRGEPDMWNESGAAEIGRRLADAVEASLVQASGAVEYRLPFRHSVNALRLPLRRASLGEYRAACRIVKMIQAREPKDPRSPRAAFNRFVAQVRANERKGGPGPYDSKLHDFVILRNNEAVIERYKNQDSQSAVTMKLHVLRLGDVAFATNPFELFLDYGQRIKARSPANQTLLVQLSGDSRGYLPTARAVACGGYGSLIINGTVGPDGGDALVERTLKAINRLWRE